MDSTIRYYDDNAEQFIKLTRDVDMSQLYRMFEVLIPRGGTILDVGCGSGRDSKYFLDNGYIVTAIDGSEVLCKAASKYVGIDVIYMNIEKMGLLGAYDGIWACASLLHIKKINMKRVLEELVGMLNANGVLYASWKYGTSERSDNGKHYSDYNEEQLMEIVDNLDVESSKIWISDDSTREEIKWINLLMHKGNRLSTKTE